LMRKANTLSTARVFLTAKESRYCEKKFREKTKRQAQHTAVGPIDDHCWIHGVGE
jgi:hypothetical protein